ncbi:MAG: Ldh family oxidoreductase, partial [Elusimicrobiota bacterium]
MTYDVFGTAFKPLRDFCANVLIAAGVRVGISKDVANSLSQASLRGVDSHGVRLLPHYIEALRSGRINPNPELKFKKTATAAGVVDADHTFGHAAGAFAMRQAMQLAQKSGIGAVSVANSSHFGAAAYFTLIAAD